MRDDVDGRIQQLKVAEIPEEILKHAVELHVTRPQKEKLVAAQYKKAIETFLEVKDLDEAVLMEYITSGEFKKDLDKINYRKLSEFGVIQNLIEGEDSFGTESKLAKKKMLKVLETTTVEVEEQFQQRIGIFSQRVVSNEDLNEIVKKRMKEYAAEPSDLLIRRL